MLRTLSFYSLILGFLASIGCSQQVAVKSDSEILVNSVTVEHLAQALGIDTRNPRISWIVEASYNGAKQTAYEIKVSSTNKNEGDVWSTGIVSSNASFDVAYNGAPLISNHRYFVSIRVHDDERISAWSKPIWFETAFLDPDEFNGQWIGRDRDRADHEKPEVLLRKQIELKKPIKSARAYVAGLGIHKAYINGSRATESELNPAYTPYNNRVLYLTYDVTDLLVDGINVLGVSLGRGFYADYNNIDTNVAPWLSEPKLKYQLQVTYADGSQDLWLSDTSWQVVDGPTLNNSLKYGEVYDARREVAGWNQSGIDTSTWANAIEVDAPTGTLSSQLLEPISRQRELAEPVISAIDETSTLYDFRATVAGWAKVFVKGPAGSEIVIKYAEKLLPDGHVNSGNDGPFGGIPVQVYRYILKGDPDGESFEPSYSYAGYRFVEIDAPTDVKVERVQGWVLNNNVSLQSSFESSDSLLNRYHKAMLNSLQSNLHNIPTDTPMYEKRGWAADALLMVDSALINFGSDLFWEKWMQDHIDNQASDGGLAVIIPNQNPGGPQDDPFVGLTGDPIWSSSFVLSNYALFLHRGNLRIVETSYPAMQRWLQKWMTTLAATDYIFDGVTWGDHEPAYGTGKDNQLVGTAYVIRSTNAMIEMANALGHEKDVLVYQTFANKVKDAVKKHFYDVETGSFDAPYSALTFGPPPGMEANADMPPLPDFMLEILNTPPEVFNAKQFQTDNVLPVALGIIEGEDKDRLCAALINDVAVTHASHITAGATVLKDVMPVLSECGAAELAYSAAVNPTFPGWGYWFETLHGSKGAGGEDIIVDGFWEAWGEHARSHNHAFRGTIDDWLFQYLAGIKPTEAGYRTIQVKPHPVGQLNSVSADFMTPLGKVASSWQVKNGNFNLQVVIPVGASAQVYLPSSQAIMDSASGAVFVGYEKGYSIYNVTSGNYSFEAPLVVAKVSSDKLATLKSYWHDGRIDFFETATEMGQHAAVNVFGYAEGSPEGLLFKEQQTNTIPLNLYWSEELQDNASLALPNTVENVTAQGYEMKATEGFIYSFPVLGTVPLALYFNPELNDYHVLASEKTKQYAIENGYQFVQVEGYVYPIQQ